MNPLGGLRETGGLPLFSPEGRTYSPPRRHKLHILRPAASGRAHPFRCASFSHKVNDFVGALLRRWYLPLASRALCEADAASAEASRQCNSTCGCCCHRLRRRQNTTTDVLVRWVTIRNPPAACLLQTQPRTILRICSGSFAADRASLEATPYSFCEKETKRQSAERWCHGSLPHLRARTQRV